MAGGGYVNIAADSAPFDASAIGNILSYKTSFYSESPVNLSLPLLSGKSQSVTILAF